MSDGTKDAEAGIAPAAEDFGAFYRREYRAVRAVAWALTGNGWSAEDVAQEAFLRAHREWARIASYEEPGAWVRRVAINLATSVLRRRAREATALLRLGGRRDDGWAMPEADAEFWSAVRSLPRRQAAVLALHYYEDLPVAEIAVVLGIAEGTVKALLHQGRASLGRRLRLDREGES